jgi:hypothetical protein
MWPLEQTFAERGVAEMLWVGVRYRGIALPDIATMMRAWLNGRGYRPNVFEYLISGSGTLIRVQFEHEVEAAEFAEEFAGSVSDDCPSIERAGVSQTTPRGGIQQE